MIYKEVLKKRLTRKREQLAELEKQLNSKGLTGSADKWKCIELKATISELENCIDIVESVMEISCDIE